MTKQPTKPDDEVVTLTVRDVATLVQFFKSLPTDMVADTILEMADHTSVPYEKIMEQFGAAFSKMAGAFDWDELVKQLTKEIAH